MVGKRGQRSGRVQVLAPSDISGRRARRGRLRVGGRVLSLAGPRTLRLGDAFGQLEVNFLDAHGAAPGDLLEVAGRYDGRSLGAAELLGRSPAPESTGQGEFARFGWQGVAGRLRARALALESVRRYFAAQGFVEVCTPTRVPAPGLDAHVHAVRSGAEWLITSPEHHMKRLLVGGLPRIFQIARCFRAEELGTLHEPEFSMLEWYRAFSDQHHVMHDTEQLVLGVVTRLVGAPRVKAGGRWLDVRPPYPRLTVRDAFQKYAGVPDAVALAERNETRFFELWVERVEPALGRRSKPLFLVDFPLCQAALARRAAHDPSVAERFELYLAGVELCNGFTELTDAREQRRRFVAERRARRARGQPVYPLDQRFLSALIEGMPPSGGNALGLDRLVMLALGASSLSEVMAFPRHSADARRT